MTCGSTDGMRWLPMKGGFRVRAVLFDFDGTLTLPGALDLPGLAREIGCPQGTPVLEYINGLPPAQRRRLDRRLEEFELAAAATSQPNLGAEEAVLALLARGVPVAILSRNGLRSIMRALDNFPRLRAGHFALIISRDDPVAPKPAPDGILLAAQKLGIPVEELAVVGDYVLDMLSARAAGALGIHLRNHGPERPDWQAHFHIPELTQLPALLELGLPLPQGKLPARYLEAFFAQAATWLQPEIVVGPGVGEDVAVIQMAPEAVQGLAPEPDRPTKAPPCLEPSGPAEASSQPAFLSVTADPITLASETVEDYLLAVNANDLATVGASPRWFLATVLLPPETTPSQALDLLRRIRRACERAHVLLIGGHTEITDAATRPLICGCLLGTAAAIIRKSGMRPGDRVLLSKRIALEGTALLARELRDELLECGLSPQDLEEAGKLLDSLSVAAEARAATALGGVTAMHDVTEGGVAEALVELGRAGRHRLSIRLDRIPFHPLTERVCAALHIDPLGLLGSGSLLLTVQPGQAEAIAQALGREGLEVTDIGEVGEEIPAEEVAADEMAAGEIAAGSGEAVTGLVTGLCHGVATPWPRFEVDEAARVLASRPSRRSLSGPASP